VTRALWKNARATAAITRDRDLAVGTPQALEERLTA